MGILSSALKVEVENQTDYTAEIELGGEKFKVGTKPLTPADFDFVNSYLAKDAKKAAVPFVPFQQDPTNFTGQVMLMIRKTRETDDDGNLGDKAFTAGDKPMLMRLGADKVATIFMALFNSMLNVDDEEADEDAAKN